MFRRLIAVLVSAFCVLAFAAAVSAAYKTVAWNPFTHRTQTRPASFALAQDGSERLTKLKWADWGSRVATGIGVESYRVPHGLRLCTVALSCQPVRSAFAHTSGTIRLTRRTICRGRIYYASAVATVTYVRDGDTTPHTFDEDFGLLPASCAPNPG